MEPLGEQHRPRRPPIKIGLLELFLLASLIGLTFQLFPGAYEWLVLLSDFRKWSRKAWLLINLVFVFSLIAVRFAPGIWTAYQRRRERIAEDRVKVQKKLEAKERRETLERIKEGRNRRVW